MAIDGYEYQMCGSSGTAANPLEVHHFTYHHLYKEEGWIEQDLITLCHVCHKSVHRMMNRTTDVQTGRRGWKDSNNIPKVHAYNLNGETEFVEEEL